MILGLYFISHFFRHHCLPLLFWPQTFQVVIIISKVFGVRETLLTGYHPSRIYQHFPYHLNGLTQVLSPSFIFPFCLRSLLHPLVGMGPQVIWLIHCYHTLLGLILLKSLFI